MRIFVCRPKLFYLNPKINFSIVQNEWESFPSSIIENLNEIREIVFKMIKIGNLGALFVVIFSTLIAIRCRYI